jgi:hypothetical protein
VALGRGRVRQTARGGRKRSTDGRWLGFKGSDGEGGPEGWTLHGGRAEERGRERGALGASWSSASAWRVAARRGSTWLTGGPGRDGGPDHQRLGAAQ